MFALESAHGRAGRRARASTRSSCGCATSRPTDPETGEPVLQPPTSSRACARAPSASAGPAAIPTPGVRREGRWLVGTGVAASTYPAAGHAVAGARAPSTRDGRYRGARSRAADIGTGRAHRAAPRSPPTRSACRVERRRRGDRRHARCPRASVAGGSIGHGVVGRRPSSSACEALRARRAAATTPADGHDARGRPRPTPRRAETSPATPSAPSSPRSRVDADTGEVRVPRAARRLRRGAHRQPAHGPLAAPRRHDHGPVDGAARGERRRPRVRRLRQPRPRRLPRRRLRRRRRHRGAPGSTRTTRTSTRWAPRASARSASSAPPRRWPTRVHHATGVRVRDLPIRLDRLLGRAGRQRAARPGRSDA